MDEAQLLARLLARHSPSGAEGAAVREFVGIARTLGYRARIDRAGNGVAERGFGRPELLYLGHIDTVEGTRPVRVARGRIHGRGAVDAKGPLACALLAGIRADGPGTLRVVAAVREETDSAGARHLLRGRRPDGVVVGEPSGWDSVTIGYRGDLRVEVVFRARRSHWSSPARTAADTAVDWLARAREVVGARSSGTPFRTLTMKLVGLADDPAADPEEARLLLDLRLPPGLSSEEALALLPAEPGSPTVRTIARLEAVERPRTDPVVRALVSAVRAVGGSPTLFRRGGSSDLNLVVPAWGVPGAAYGPGDSRLDHTDHESVAVDELRRAGSVLERAFVELRARPVVV